MVTTRRRVAGLAGAALFLFAACTGGGATPTAAPTTAPTTAPPSAEASAPASVAPSAPPSSCRTRSSPPASSSGASTSATRPRSSTPLTARPPRASDVDIATEIGKRFGRHDARSTTPGSTGSSRPSLAKKCDLIISGMNATAERAKQVDFVDYLKVGQGSSSRPATRRASRPSTTCPARSSRSSSGRPTRTPSTPTNKELKAAGKAADRDPDVPEGHGRVPAARARARRRVLDRLAGRRLLQQQARERGQVRGRRHADRSRRRSASRSARTTPSSRRR